MLRTCLLACALTAVAFGCTGKKPTPADSSEDVSNPGSEPAAAYTIKVREEQAGDKFVATETTTSSFTTTRSGLKGKATDGKKSTEKVEYMETIIEFPNGSDWPTRFTRAYKASEEAPADGPAKSASYVGKTVLYEKKNGAYTITANGQPLPAAEEQPFRSQLERPRVRDSELVPKAPVKLNEAWALDPVLVRRFAGLLNFPINKEKSQGTGKLIKVYAKAGKQWGVIEHKITLVIENTAPGVIVSGTVTFSVTTDAVIDGTSSEATTKSKLSATVLNTQGPNKLEAALDVERATTQSPAK